MCAGITQGLTLTCRALGRAGVRRIAVEDPCFGVHRRAIAMTGLEPVPIPAGEHGLDPDLLEAADVGAVVVTPAHSYPAGGTLTPARRHALLDWARRRDAVIVEDDYDAELRYDRTPIGALQGHAPDRVVYLGSASKTVSPALRLGWLAAPAGLVDAIADEKHVDDMGSTLFEQLAFARFLAAGDFTRHLRRIRPVYRARRDATAPRRRRAAAGRAPARGRRRPAPVRRAGRGGRRACGGRRRARPRPPGRDRLVALGRPRARRALDRPRLRRARRAGDPARDRGAGRGRGGQQRAGASERPTPIHRLTADMLPHVRFGCTPAGAAVAGRWHAPASARDAGASVTAAAKASVVTATVAASRCASRTARVHGSPSRIAGS